RGWLRGAGVGGWCCAVRSRSGVEVLREGWRGLPLPVRRSVGRFGTSSPLVEAKVVSIAMGGDVVPAGLVSALEQGSGRWVAVAAGWSSPPVQLSWHFTSTSGGKSRFHRHGWRRGARRSGLGPGTRLWAMGGGGCSVEFAAGGSLLAALPI